MQKAKIWADVEIFEFENEVYKSALMPASFDRVLRQLEAVSPWVDQILVYQYQGMMNKPIPQPLQVAKRQPDCTPTTSTGSPADVRTIWDNAVSASVVQENWRHPKASNPRAHRELSAWNTEGAAH